MTSEEKDCVEKMLTHFIVESIKGIRADYFRKMIKIYTFETSWEDGSGFQDEPAAAQANSICIGLCVNCGKAGLCEAMYELTEQQRFIIEKIFTERYKEHEVAQMLGVAQQTVHYHKSRALKKLRSELLRASKEGRWSL